MPHGHLISLTVSKHKINIRAIIKSNPFHYPFSHDSHLYHQFLNAYA
uniref:Uncharacterized protein n=1 Tax=Arundo donax TaxID=35708 RepID=A0A0A9GJL4_ARUDO